MKSTLFLLVLQFVLIQPQFANAAPVQDLDRINDLVNQARSLADGARSNPSPLQRRVGVQSPSQFKNPFATTVSDRGVDVQSENGPAVKVDPSKIGINVGGRQFEIPRNSGIGDTVGVDSYLHLPAPRNYGGSSIAEGVIGRRSLNPVNQAMATAGNYRVFGDAVRAFRVGEFESALSLIREVKTHGKKAVFDQFQSLCLFASGDYLKSAEFAYAATSQSQLFSWDQLRSYYGNPDLYAQQYRKLQRNVTEHDSNPSLRFLLGYHHLILGHRQQASQEFEFVLSKLPGDPVVTQLLEVSKQRPPSPLN